MIYCNVGDDVGINVDADVGTDVGALVNTDNVGADIEGGRGRYLIV